MAQNLINFGGTIFVGTTVGSKLGGKLNSVLLLSEVDREKSPENAHKSEGENSILESEGENGGKKGLTRRKRGWWIVCKERELWRIGGERGREEEPRVEEEESETL